MTERSIDEQGLTRHITRAIELAYQAGARGDRPFGAVLLDADGHPLAEGLNAVTTTGDIRAHAELDAIENARAAGDGARVAGGTMIASGEPCPMCAAGMVWAGITRILYAAAGPDFGAILTDGPRFDLRCADVIAASTEPITVEGPIDGVDALGPFKAFTGLTGPPPATPHPQ